MPDRKKTPQFAHPSEAEFSRILDFYQIDWLYEPYTFPLRWDDSGRVQECFSPDFYLPELDLFIELTTLKQSLVTKKNRKIRQLRAMYPGLNIKIFYGKDYRNLALKYGLAPPPEGYVPGVGPKAAAKAMNEQHS
ncbi:MAG: PDDEXK family nuclease [Candidatus Xenobia bacterium]